MPKTNEMRKWDQSKQYHEKHFAMFCLMQKSILVLLDRFFSNFFISTP